MLLHTKITCMSILEPLLSTVTVVIGMLVIFGSKFLYTIVKEICLWDQPHFDTFHRHINVEVLWSHSVWQAGTSKQVAVAWSKIRAVRRVVRQLPVDMLSGAIVWTALCGHALSCVSWLLFWMALQIFLSFCNILLMLVCSLFLSCPREQFISTLWQSDISSNLFNNHKLNPGCSACYLYVIDTFIAIFMLLLQKSKPSSAFLAHPSCTKFVIILA
jgi:hypothetical protein